MVWLRHTKHIFSILNHDIAIQQHEHFIFVDGPYIQQHCRDTSIGVCMRTQPTQQRSDANKCVKPIHGKKIDYNKSAPLPYFKSEA